MSKIAIIKQFKKNRGVHRGNPVVERAEFVVILEGILRHVMLKEVLRNRSILDFVYSLLIKRNFSLCKIQS